MVNSRPLEEKVEAIFIYEATRNFHETERLFNERFPDRPICRKYLRELVNKFTTTGTVQDKKRPGHKSILEEKQVQIIGEIIENPQHSTPTVADICEVSTSTGWRVLNKFHPYKIQMVHQLTEDDPDRRVQFCEIMAERVERQPTYVRNICFSDECTFFF